MEASQDKGGQPIEKKEYSISVLDAQYNMLAHFFTVAKTIGKVKVLISGKSIRATYEYM